MRQDLKSKATKELIIQKSFEISNEFLPRERLEKEHKVEQIELFNNVTLDENRVLSYQETIGRQSGSLNWRKTRQEHE